MIQNAVATNDICVGVIPIGTGNDWVKTHHISSQFKKAIQTIKNGTLKLQDVGKIDLRKQIKKPVYFINLSGVGFDGYVVSKVGKYKHFGALAYLIGAVLGLFSFKNFNVEVVTNSQTIKAKSLMVLVGLCKYSGGGMQLTDYKNPNNGLFDVSVAKDFSKWDIIKNMTKLFNGSIVKLKKVDTLKTNCITILSSNEINQPYIQADGELIGTGDIKVSIISKAFSFYTK